MITTAADIQAEVSAYFGIAPGLFLALDHSRAASRPRQIAMFLTRELTDLSWPKIATAFCRDLATVYQGARSITGLYQRDTFVRLAVDECRDSVLAARAR